jgi:hypothetical protein
MKTDLLSIIETACLVGAIALVGCSSTTTPNNAADGGAAGCPGKSDAGCPGKSDAGCPASDAGCPASDAGCPATGTPGDAQTPPTGTQAAVEAWLAAGSYKGAGWKCEAAVHPARATGMSPHGMNRICSNTKLSTATGTGEYPIGSAGVKELYDDAGTKIVGYATYLKTKAGAGESWYWYERAEAFGATAVANGPGNAGTPLTVCVGCHSKAPRDNVFTPVQ